MYLIDILYCCFCLLTYPPKKFTQYRGRIQGQIHINNKRSTYNFYIPP